MLFEAVSLLLLLSYQGASFLIERRPLEEETKTIHGRAFARRSAGTCSLKEAIDRVLAANSAAHIQ